VHASSVQTLLHPPSLSSHETEFFINGIDASINGINALINCENKQFNKTNPPQTRNTPFQHCSSMPKTIDGTKKS